MPRQFSFRGDRLAYSWGIVLLAGDRVRPAVGVRRRHPRPDPAVLGRRVRVLHPEPDRDGPALVQRSRERLALAGGGQRLRRGADGGRPRRRRLREVHRRRVPRRHPHPAASSAMMLFIHHQYSRSQPRAGGRARPRRPAAAPRGTRRRPDPGPQPGGRPGDQRRPLDRRRHPGRLHLGRPEHGGQLRERLRAAGARACRSSSSSRRTARWPGRCSPTSTSSTRPGRRARPAPITFVVIPEYVARHWWERILYNQASKRLRTVLLGRPHTVVVDVPYRREDPALFEAAHGRASAAGAGPAAPSPAGPGIADAAAG